MDVANLTVADLTHCDTLADPYPTYAALRQQDPIHRDPETSCWMVTRHADVVTILGDRRFSTVRARTDRDADIGPIEQALAMQMLFLDPPDHTRLRRLFVKAFTASRVERLRPEIAALANRLFHEAALTSDGLVDFAKDIASPLPVMIIAQLLGVPAEDWQKTCVWSYSLGRFLTLKTPAPAELATMQQDVLALINYFQRLVEHRKIMPGDDMLSDLLAADDLGERLSTQELIVNLVLLFAAGHLTTTNLLSNSLLALSRFPDQWNLIVTEPGLVQQAVGELIRFDTPVQAVDRYACEDVEIGGRRIGAGDQVIIFLGSGNRDEACFAEPDSLQIRRRSQRILSFGYGIHACLGAALARLETEVVLGELIRRFPNSQVCGSSSARLPSHMIRSVGSLPVVLR